VGIRAWPLGIAERKSRPRRSLAPVRSGSFRFAPVPTEPHSQRNPISNGTEFQPQRGVPAPKGLI
jgi:hypothetical protein